MDIHDYRFLLSERSTLNKLINQVSESDVIGRMSLQARLKDVEEGLKAGERSYQQLGESCSTHVAPESTPAKKKDKITMQLSESIEKTGFFWLPENPRNQLPGILRISEAGKITLEISYLNASQDSTQNFPPRFLGVPEGKNQDRINRIIGIIENESVTLDKCFYGPTTWTGGVSTATIYAERTFIGAHYKEEEISFSEIRVSIDGLDKWLSAPRFRLEQNWKENGGLESSFIHFSPLEEISLDLPIGIELKFTLSESWLSSSTEASINQKAYISLKSKELRSIEYFLALVSKFHNFLCFAIDKIVSLDSVTGYSCEKTLENGRGEYYKVPIEMYYRSIPHYKIRPEIHRSDMLFCYQDVADQIKTILAKWLEAYEVYEPAFNLYFASMFDSHIEFKFLSLVQGIETLHRRSSQEKEMPEEEFNNLVDDMLKVVPQNKKNLIKNKLKYANEISLRKRIHKMIEPFKDLFGNSREQKLFTQKIIDTRNYLTHYDRQLEEKASTREDLWNLCLTLEALFQLHLLRLIEMDALALNRRCSPEKPIWVAE